MTDNIVRANSVMFNSYTGSLTTSFNATMNVRFGVGASETFGVELVKNGLRRALLVVDPGVAEAGLGKQVAAALREAGMECALFSEVSPNPNDKEVYASTEAAKKFDADVIIGLGGGSAMDVAKASAIMVTNPGKIQDYDGVDKVSEQPPFLVCIPTTAGTGSEVTANAAITNSDNHYKMSIRSPRIIPSLAILDPALLRSLPPMPAATASIDAMTHALEGYLSVRSSVLSDHFACEALRLLNRNIRAFCANPGNLEAAAEMLLGSMYAGFVISNTGTGACHAMARALGGLYNMQHGLACAITIPPVLAFNGVARPDKYKVIAEILGVESSQNPQATADALADYMRALSTELRVPTRLSNAGVKDDRLDELVGVAISNVGPNPRLINKADLRDLFSACH